MKEDGHAIKITGLTSEGVIGSSWGHRVLIPYTDLVCTDAYRLSSTHFNTSYMN